MEHKMISLADQVYEKIEADILTGALQRGEIVTEIKLSERLAVSRSPVREAMQRLEHDHLLETVGKTSRVVGVTQEDLQDILLIRMRLEGIATARAARNAPEEGIGELREALDVQEFYTGKQDPVGIRDMDNRFHQIIYRLCGSAPLRYTLEPLHRRIVRYRQVSITDHQRAEESLDEHRAILNAIADRDEAAAETLAIAHVEHAMRHILKGA